MEQLEEQKAKGSAPLTYRLLAGAMILQATYLLVIVWIPSIPPYLASKRIVLTVGWLWFLWPIILLAHPARSLRRWIIPVVIGFLLLLPCLFALFALTVWSINGFAP